MIYDKSDWRAAGASQRMSSVLLVSFLPTNKKHGKNYQVDVAHLTNPNYFRIYQKKYIYFSKGKLKEHLEILKTSCDSYVGLDLSIHGNKIPINLGTQYL